MAEKEIRELLEEVREEHRLNRIAYAQQLDLTRTVVQRNAEAFQGLMAALDRFGERVEEFGERIDSFGERVDAFGATLDIQREILLRFLDRLDDQLPPLG